MGALKDVWNDTKAGLRVFQMHAKIEAMVQAGREWLAQNAGVIVTVPCSANESDGFLMNTGPALQLRNAMTTGPMTPAFAIAVSELARTSDEGTFLRPHYRIRLQNFTPR